jgi:ketosteroid isomerase-like protein
MRLMLSLLASLVLLAVANVASADDVNATVTTTLRNYVAAFSSRDMTRILPFFDEPVVLITAAGTSVMPTHAEVDALLTKLLAKLKDRNFDHAEWPQLNVKMLNDNLAIASALVVRYKTGGEELERFGATFLLRRSGDAWKITMQSVHDAGTVIEMQ